MEKIKIINNIRIIPKDAIMEPFFKENETIQKILSLLLSIVILLCPIIFEFAWKKLLSSKFLDKILILSEVPIYLNPSFEIAILSKLDIVQFIKKVSAYLSGKIHDAFLIELENLTWMSALLLIFSL